MILTPVTAFLFVLIIGIVCGLAFDRFMGAGWLTRQIAGTTRHSATSALVGIAGAFIGFHLFIILSIVTGIATLLGAVLGALVVLFVWHRM
jgi:uncharacterized membrane protein YeaQ/YmgE (transglycosylase-associated protein family)